MEIEKPKTGHNEPRQIFDSKSHLTSHQNAIANDNINESDFNNDLWKKIRVGFDLPTIKGKTVKRYQTWFLNNPEYMQRVFKRCELYLHYVVTEIEKRKMPMEIALLPIIESAYNPYAYSRAHASGVWQFIPGTGTKFGIKQNWWVDERRDITVATSAALEYLTILHAEFDDWQLALAAYNCGENCVRRAILRNKKRGRPTTYKHLRLPRETKRYVPKLQAIKNIIANPQAVGYDLKPIKNAPYFSKVIVNESIDVVLAAKLANLSIPDFLLLNPSYHRPVIIAESHRPILVPKVNAITFETNLKNLSTPKLSWRIYKLKKSRKTKDLAKTFNMSADKLLKINGIRSTDHIIKGTMILVPTKGITTTSNLEEMWSHQNFTQTTSFYKQKIFHSVRGGDNLTKISRRYNVSVKSLKSWNKIKGSLIKKGQKLIIYGNPTSHRVKAGDTLSGISRKYGISIAKIKKWNKLKTNLIRIGQRLLLYKNSKAPLLKDLLI